MGRGPQARWWGLRPFRHRPDPDPVRLQLSCASLDAVVNYFVSNTNRRLVPFRLDEDYEKVLGAASGNRGAPAPTGHPWANAQPPHLL